MKQPNLKENPISLFIQAKSVFHMSVLFKYLASSKNTHFESETSLHIQAQPGNPCYQPASILRKRFYNTSTTFLIHSDSTQV